MTETNGPENNESRTSVTDMWKACRHEVCALAVGALVFGSALAFSISDGGPTRTDVGVAVIAGAVALAAGLNLRRRLKSFKL